MRQLLAVFLASLSLSSLAQSATPPAKFRLVMPKGPGSILIDTTGGWDIQRFVLYEAGKRPVIQMENKSLKLVASYIMFSDFSYQMTSNDCRNDSLNGIFKGALANATVKNKQAALRTAKNGQQVATGSYFIAKNEGIEVQQQNVFGFIAQDHTCAEVHLSRAPFSGGDLSVFETVLDAFTYDPSYIPTSADYALMEKMLPPGMAASYGTHDGNTSERGAAPASAQSLDFTLASHPGRLHMDAPNFAPVEYSAKPDGLEFGIRAIDKQHQVEALSFLFRPSPAQPTAAACRDWMLASEKKDGATYRKITGQEILKSDSGVEIAAVNYEQSKKPSPSQYVRRGFVAQGDLCADISIFASNPILIATTKSLFETLTFDAAQRPGFLDTFRYATVLYDHHQYAAAAPIFETALTLVSTSPDPTTWRRVATDQASMSYGMAGDLKRSRAVNEAAILKDPTYPLYYYNLACADAEAGDATAARAHLQQASDRRANTIKGESLPDPTKDDSILKLKSNKDFWTFVQSLPKS